jgi:hypothetical protein
VTDDEIVEWARETHPNAERIAPFRVGISDGAVLSFPTGIVLLRIGIDEWDYGIEERLTQESWRALRAAGDEAMGEP